MHWIRRNFGIAVLATILASGCGESSRVDTPEVNPSEDWVMIDGVEFPAIMSQVPEDVVEIYVFAAKNPDVLEYIPCYCGCEDETPPHVSAYDCFVDAIDRSGPVPRVELDLMGFG